MQRRWKTDGKLKGESLSLFPSSMCSLPSSSSSSSTSSSSTKLVIPIEKRNGGEKTSGGKSKIVSRDASVVGSNLGRGTRANPNPAYPESNFESFESDPPSLLSPLPASSREESRKGGWRWSVSRERSRILSLLEGPRHPCQPNFSTVPTSTTTTPSKSLESRYQPGAVVFLDFGRGN